jgi:hypothetical protein
MPSVLSCVLCNRLAELPFWHRTVAGQTGGGEATTSWDERTVLLTLTILLEIDPIDRFDTRPPFCSSARLAGAVQTSDHKRTGAGNRKAGNAWLPGAFSEAAVLSAPKKEPLGALRQRLAAKLGKAKALSALAHQLGRAFYPLLHTKEVFAVHRFVRH